MNNQELLKEFVEKVQWLNEIEYGDFRRKLGLYLNRLDKELKNPDPALRKAIANLRLKVVYDPEPDIEGTRRLVVNSIRGLLH